MVFPKYISLNKKFGVTNTCQFMHYYKKWIDSKGAAASIAVTAIAKQPANYKN